MKIWLSLLTFFLAWELVSAVYLYDGNPYQQTNAIGVGSLEFGKEQDGIPIHTQVTYPIDPGEYVPLFFVPGLNGVVYPEFYSVVTSRLASFGYLVAAVDLYWPARDNILFESRNAELSFKVVQWLKDNLVSKYLPQAGSPNVTVNWSRLGLLSHSLGGDTLIKMLAMDEQFAKATVFLEPGSASFKTPLNFSIPSLTTGTEYCTQLPACCLKGSSYNHFYSNLQCPKIVLNITGVGHCSIIDENAWDLCHLSHFCKTNKTSDRTLYRDVFMPGLLASFYGAYLQGNSAMLQYSTKPSLMPMTVDYIRTDLQCTHHH